MIRRSDITRLYGLFQSLCRDRFKLCKERLSETTRAIIDCISVHVQVPMPIAKGKGGLVRKVAALIHALFLDTGSSAILRGVLSSSISTTTGN